MCEPASYFEQEAAAISRARGLGSPATSNPHLGANQPPVLVHGAACFPASLRTLPDACRLSAFIFSVIFFPRHHAERKKAVIAVGLLWHSLLSIAPGNFSLHAHSHAGTTQ